MPAPRFDAVDATDPAAAAAFLDLALSLPEVERWKRLSYDLLELQDGDRVLDLGCGTGADAMILARRVGTAGQVVGIDLSRSLIAIAEARASGLGLPLTFRCADIYHLPFADGSFDRTRIDRVLHFLPNPGLALQEAVRVSRPGGRLVVTEPDWGSLTVSGGDPGLTSLVMEDGANWAPSARIGSALQQLLEDAGLRSMDNHEATLELRDYAIAVALLGLEGVAARAIELGRVDTKAAVQWLRSLQRASAQGMLRCTLKGAITSGIRA